MGFAKIVILFILIQVYDGRQKFVSTVLPTSTDTSTPQNLQGTRITSDQLVAFEMQVAGHNPAAGKGKGMFRDAEGNLLKGRSKEREVIFYKNLENADDPILKELREYVPRYCGFKTMKAKDKDKEYTYLCIEDQTRGFTLASAIDIKMGKRICRPGKLESRFLRGKWKYPQRERYGFCIPGAKFYDIHTYELRTYARPFTYTMTPQQTIQVLYEFVNRESGLELGLVDKILDELQKIYSWFKRQRHYKFHGSSILIVYDTVSLKKNQPIVRVRMIDFAYALLNSENERQPDKNFIGGLKNVIGLLKNLKIAVRKYTNILDQPGASSHGNPIMNDNEEEISVHVSLPRPGWQPFDQIAGHVINKGGEKLDLLEDLQGNLGKPDPQQEEIDFYETLRNTQNPILIELKQYVPEYFGTKIMEIEKKTIKFIHIENILKDFKVPSYVDVKMGIKSRPDWAPSKVAEGKYEAMLAVWKFVIPAYEGYSVPLEEDAKLEKKSRKRKYYVHHNMMPSEGVTTLYEFVNGEWGIKCGLVDSLLDELRKIESWFQRQRHYRFYDSSLFLTYDGKRLDDFAKGLITESDCRGLKVPVKVRMIDFDNTFTEIEDEPDENYLEALQNLMWIFKNFTKNNFDPDLLPIGYQHT